MYYEQENKRQRYSPFLNHHENGSTCICMKMYITSNQNYFFICLFMERIRVTQTFCRILYRMKIYYPHCFVLFLFVTYIVDYVTIYLFVLIVFQCNMFISTLYMANDTYVIEKLIFFYVYIRFYLSVHFPLIVNILFTHCSLS